MSCVCWCLCFFRQDLKECVSWNQFHWCLQFYVKPDKQTPMDRDMVFWQGKKVNMHHLKKETLYYIFFHRPSLEFRYMQSLLVWNTFTSVIQEFATVGGLLIYLHSILIVTSSFRIFYVKYNPNIWATRIKYL